MVKRATQYPSWAPEELCTYHQECLENGSEYDELETFQILERMIFDERMEWVWIELKEFAEKNGIQGYAIDIYLTATNTQGLYGAERLTQAELRKVVEKIEKLSTKLADLVEQIMPICLIDGVDPPKLVSPVVRELGAQAREVLERPRLLSKVQVKNQRQQVLVRSLYRMFRERFGRPFLRLIAEIHDVVLQVADDEMLDERAVSDIVRGLP
ncbi:MAG TPA: hypothetical protein ENI99_04065 [Sedimenticola sp.]|nr:hypothetical protein [Sedimenticola sp.]